MLPWFPEMLQETEKVFTANARGHVGIQTVSSLERHKLKPNNASSQRESFNLRNPVNSDFIQ